MSCQKKAPLRLPERKNALGGLSVGEAAEPGRLNFRVVTRAPMWAGNERSAAARPVTIWCGCWAVIRRALGGRADWRALPGWYPSSPAAMCRLWTGNVGARDVRFCDTFSPSSPMGGRPRPPSRRQARNGGKAGWFPQRSDTPQPRGSPARGAGAEAD